MTGRPGIRLRGLAARLLSARATERFVDPAVADLQHEYEAELRAGRRWRARLVRVFGAMRLLQLVAILGGRRVLQIGCDRMFQPVRSVPAIAGGTAAFGVLSIVLIGVLFTNVPLDLVGHPHDMRLASLLIPATLVVSVPCGFAFGAIIAVGRSAGVRQRMALLVTAAALSGVSFAVLAAAAPRTNQMFRVAVAGHPLAPGLNELTWGELRELADAPVDQGGDVVRDDRPDWRDFIQPVDARALLFAYYSRISASLAPLVLCLFALSLSNRGRAIRTTAVLFVWAGYLFWFAWLRDPLVTFAAAPPALLAWMPDVFVLVPTFMLAIARFRSESPSSSLGI